MEDPGGWTHDTAFEGMSVVTICFSIWPLCIMPLHFLYAIFLMEVYISISCCLNYRKHLCVGVGVCMFRRLVDVYKISHAIVHVCVSMLLCSQIPRKMSFRSSTVQQLHRCSQMNQQALKRAHVRLVILNVWSCRSIFFKAICRSALWLCRVQFVVVPYDLPRVPILFLGSSSNKTIERR